MGAMKRKMAVWGHGVWKVQVTHLQFSQGKLYFFLHMVFAPWAQASPGLFFSAAPVQINYIVSWFQLHYKYHCSSYTRLQWHCSLELLFGSALDFHCTFPSLFSLRKRFVIHFQGVQCNWVSLGRLTRNETLKLYHILSAPCVSLHRSILYLWFGLALLPTSV